MSDGVLYVIATPIGNLEDITLRALRILKEADVVLCEDTRHSRRLLDHYAITTPLRSHHAHSSERDFERVLEELREGKRVALISDAGTPLVSDPGAELVARAALEGLRVEALPGPSALLAALCVSGLRTDGFRFLGFLPRSGGRRDAALRSIADDTTTTVVYEAANRTKETCRDLLALLGSERRVAMCRELTKRHEQVVRGTLPEVIAHLDDELLGEVVLVIEGASDRVDERNDDASIDAFAAARLGAGDSAKDVARAVATTFGLARKDAYARVLGLLKTSP